MFQPLVRRLSLALAALVLAHPALAQGQPPHAWLFGSWTGGLFPPPSNVTAQVCLAQPVVIFTRDVVLQATLTDLLYTQHSIESARTNPGVTEFRFLAAAPVASGDVLGTPQAAVGFGCENPNVLHVQRRTDNEIAFPGCSGFPYPLIRCPGR